MIQKFIFIKLKSFFRNQKESWRFLSTFFILLLSIFYGFIFARALNDTSGVEFTKKMIYGLLGGFTLLRMIFPSYIPLNRTLPNFYPLSKTQKYLISLISDFQKSYFLYVFLFIVTIFLFSNKNNEDLTFLISNLSIVLLAQLLRRSIQYLIDFKVKKHILKVSILFIISLFTISYYLLIEQLISIQLIGIITILFFLIFGYFQELAIISSKRIQSKIQLIKLGIIPKLLINNKKVRLLILISFVLKLFILLYFFSDEKQLEKPFSIFKLYITPLIFFSYIFNNIWGFWQHIWLNYELRNGSFKPLILQTLKLMLFPILLDMIITSVILIILKASAINFIYYYVSLICLTFISFFWSVVYPMKVTTIFSFGTRKTTSTISNIIIILMTGILLTIFINQWFYIFVPVFLIGSILCFWFISKSYKKHTYKMFKIFFR